MSMAEANNMRVVSINLFGKMVKKKSALTPALSPRRGRTAATLLENVDGVRALSASLWFTVRRSKWNDVPARHNTRQTSLPLPGGEGRGEGERFPTT